MFRSLCALLIIAVVLGILFYEGRKLKARENASDDLADGEEPSRYFVRIGNEFHPVSSRRANRIERAADDPLGVFAAGIPSHHSRIIGDD